MSQESRQVFEAIERWQARGLVDPGLAERLRREVAESSEEGTLRLGQYVVAATGAVVLIIAAGVFLDWAWPRMTDALRSGFLGLLGAGVYLWGARLEGRRRWIPAAYLMQASGLALILGACMYSEQAWPDTTAGGIVAGAVALLTPAVLTPRSFRHGAFMPSVHLAFGLGFLAVFLDRATPLSADATVWVLDGVLAVAALVLVQLLRSDPSGARHPWALNGFVTTVYAAFVLIVLTASGPLGMKESTVYPLDVWLFVVLALTLWGIHRAPQGLQREWFGVQLAYALLAWIPLGLYTVAEALKAPSEMALLFVGGAGMAGFSYAVRYRIRRVLAVSALVFIAAVWFWAVDRGGALGAALALAATAAALFFYSGRMKGLATPDKPDDAGAP